MNADQYLRQQMAEQGYELTPDQAQKAGKAADEFLDQCATSLQENPDFIEMCDQALEDEELLNDLSEDARGLGIKDMCPDDMRKLVKLLKKGSEIALERGV